MSCFINAEILIKRYIRKHDLIKLGYDFSKIFDDLNDVIKYVKANKKLGFIGNEDNKPLQPTETKPEQLLSKNKKVAQPQNEKNYSLKEIAIAYGIMSITITSENADNILKKHSALTSAGKLLQKRVNHVSKLSLLSENKTVDSKHLKSLENAKRLLSGIKNKKGLTDINRIITAFKTAFDSHY